MFEAWTHLEVEMHEDATITVAKYSNYDWDDDGNEVIVYDDVDIESVQDIYVAVNQSMVDCVEDMVGTETSPDYGERWFVALCNGHESGFHGYCIDQCVLDELRDKNEVVLRPLGHAWDDEVSATVRKMYGSDVA